MKLRGNRNSSKKLAIREETGIERKQELWEETKSQGGNRNSKEVKIDKGKKQAVIVDASLYAGAFQERLLMKHHQ